MRLARFSFLSISSVLWCLVAANLLQAATLTKVDQNHPQHCSILLEGTIAAGDAAKLARFQKEIWPGESGANEGPGDGGTLCLDSPGGSLKAAVAMAKIRNGPTVVVPGATCESACSVLFMSGNVAGIPNRTLHPSSRLGFHAPDLEIADGQYNEQAVRKAYEVAILAIAEVASLEILPPQIMKWFASTPSRSMFYLEKIHQLNENDIHIGGHLGIPAIAVEKMIENICFYHFRRNRHGQDPKFSPHQPTEITSIKNNQYTKGFDVVGKAMVHEAEESYGDCKVTGWISYPVEGEPGGFYGNVELWWGSASFSSKDAWPVDSPLAGARQTMGYDQLARMMKPRMAHANHSCVIGSAKASVINVNEFVNVRSGPSLTAPIVGKAFKGETISLLKPTTYHVLRSSSGQACLKTCRGFSQNRRDQTLQARVNQCVNDKQIWQQVRKTNGTTGYVSVFFLKAQ